MFDPLSLAAAGVSAAGSIFSNIFGANSAQQSYATRYQTQMKDMQKAGLNPMLSYMQSPGSAPTFTPSNVGQAAVEGYQSGANSATVSATRNATVQNILADTQTKEANALAAKASAASSLATAENTKVTTAMQAAQLPYAGPKAAADWDVRNSEAYSKRYSLPSEKGSHDFYMSDIGKWAQRVGLLINNLTGGGNSATAVSSAARLIGRR